MGNACSHKITASSIAERNSLDAAKVEATIGNRMLAELGLATGVR